MKRRIAAAGLAAGAAAGAAYALVLRGRQLRCGATDREVTARLDGDELIGRADLTATRAITIGAPAAEVWPWIAQLGQGRGGFYSYDCLENMAGCHIRSAEEIVDEWQEIQPGDEIRLAPEVGLEVAAVTDERSLVLRGGVAIGPSAPPYDFTWAFVLDEQPDGTTRLVVRERYGYKRPWARCLVEPVEIISLIMTRKMLSGIRDRAERAG